MDVLKLSVKLHCRFADSNRRLGHHVHYPLSVTVSGHAVLSRYARTDGPMIFSDIVHEDLAFVSCSKMWRDRHRALQPAYKLQALSKGPQASSCLLGHVHLVCFQGCMPCRLSGARPYKAIVRHCALGRPGKELMSHECSGLDVLWVFQFT